MVKMVSSFAALLALLPLVSALGLRAATATSAAPASTAKIGLNTAAREAGKLYFGSATDNSELTDAPYVKILKDNTEFGQITPANTMKWYATEPERNNFTFAQGDVIAEFARSNGKVLRGHNCVWYNQLAPWVTATNWTALELAEIVTNHCARLVEHYRGQVYAWDVINEPFNDDGTWRQDIWYNTLNTSYIPLTLWAARLADPFAKLYINEYNLEYAGPKINAMVALIKQLKRDGVPIDGVGFQGHLIVGEVPSDFATQLEAITSLGVEVAITELDIRMPTPPTAASLAQQKIDYETVIKACKSVAKCVGVTVWDYTDKYSWVPSTFAGQGAACPWDENLVRKPAYDGIAVGFTSRS